LERGKKRAKEKDIDIDRIERFVIGFLHPSSSSSPFEACLTEEIFLPTSQNNSRFDTFWDFHEEGSVTIPGFHIVPVGGE
jgi:hypothetical protein